MPRSTTNFDTVRKIGLALPGVEESTAYGSPALKVRRKLLACVPAHRSAEPETIRCQILSGCSGEISKGSRFFFRSANMLERTEEGSLRE
jgi:hypothetical protein